MSVKGYFDDNFTLMKLGFGIRFGDLYEREGLMRLDQAFLRFLRESDAVLHERLLAARQTPQKLAAKEESDLLVALAPHVEDFLPKLFGIEAEARIALVQRMVIATREKWTNVELHIPARSEQLP